MNGLLVVNKDSGYTSRDVVNVISKKFNTKKVGHTGTLDPMATGVLVILIGKYTKLADLLSSSYKEYIATIKIGIKTDSLDITGNVIEERKCVIPNNVRKIIMGFKKTYNQEVPLYSATHVNGKRLYMYARNNTSVTLPSKEVTIKEIEVLDIKEDTITIKTMVSKGTYIRSLIKDICDELGIIGTMASLNRTIQGKFVISNSNKLDDIKNDNYNLLSIEDFMDIKVIELTEDLYNKVKNGSQIEDLFKEDMALLKYNKQEIALYKNDNNICKCYIML